MVKALLELQYSPETHEHLKNGLMLAAIDALDRNVVRNDMIDVMSTSLSLNDHLGRLEVVASVTALLDQGKLDRAALTEALDGLLKTIEKERVKLLTQFKLIMQCPLSNDTRH